MQGAVSECVQYDHLPIEESTVQCDDLPVDETHAECSASETL